MGEIVRHCLTRGCVRIATHGPRCRRCAGERKATNFYATPEWRRLSRRVIARDGNCCVACPNTKRLVAHHVKGRRGGGRDAMSNLITLCHDCHVRYEGDLRAGRDSDHRRLIDHIAEQLLGQHPET